MYIKINNKKIKVQELTTFRQKLKSLRFVFEPIKDAYKLVKKKTVNTYYFIQRVDVVMTDKDNKILYLYENVKNEKLILFKRKVYNIYYLPLNSVKYLKVGDKLKEYK